MRRIIAFCIVFGMLFVFSACDDEDSGAGGGKIRITLISETDQGDWGNVERCTHYYSVSGPEAIAKTSLPHNKETAFDLSKSKEEYTLIISHEGVYANGQKSKLVEEKYKFKGNKSITAKYGCTFRGGAHSIEYIKGKMERQ